MNEILIVAPHIDDEVISSFEILQTKVLTTIVYTDCDDWSDVRRSEIEKIRDIFNIKNILFFSDLTNYTDFMTKIKYTYYFPDPIYETHPEHRKQGYIGEQMFRDGKDVVFYNTTMTAPYIHKVKNWQRKKEILNKLYPSQKSLWEYEHKYFLWEGRCKYLP